MARKTPREEAARWEIWPGPARGYIALENDLPVIADALEALWLLRARQREIEALLAATAYRVVPAPQPRGEALLAATAYRVVPAPQPRGGGSRA